MDDELGLVLEPGERARAGELLTAFFHDYEHSLRERPLVPEVDRRALAELLADPFPDKGIGVEALFREINGTVLPNSTTVAHPRFLAYVLGPPNGIAPYAEAIAATLNQNCNFWQLSPAASVIERSVIAWLGSLFGYDDRAGGILTGGGSLATLSALTTALHARRPGYREQGLQHGAPPLIIYTSAEAHRCVDKAAAILGLGLDQVRHLPTDRQHRLRVDALAQAARADRAAGFEPFCVVATPGTVTTGSLDPIDAIADLCQEHDLWLHLDGAYGGLFALADRFRDYFAACARADSIAVDPHKLLFAPLEAGCLLVRDRARLARTFAFSSSYLPAAEDPLLVDYMDHGPQLSRDFKAFKIWAALRTFGVEAFRAAIDRTLDLAQHLGRLIDADPNLELLAPVTLTAVCFRITGATEADHQAALATLNREGIALLGPAVVGGQDCLRACVANFRTTAADVEQIAGFLSDLAATVPR